MPSTTTTKRPSADDFLDLVTEAGIEQAIARFELHGEATAIRSAVAGVRRANARATELRDLQLAAERAEAMERGRLAEVLSRR